MNHISSLKLCIGAIDTPKPRGYIMAKSHCHRNASTAIAIATYCHFPWQVFIRVQTKQQCITHVRQVSSYQLCFQSTDPQVCLGSRQNLLSLKHVIATKRCYVTPLTIPYYNVITFNKFTNRKQFHIAYLYLRTFERSEKSICLNQWSRFLLSQILYTIFRLSSRINSLKIVIKNQ